MLTDGPHAIHIITSVAPGRSAPAAAARGQKSRDDEKIDFCSVRRSAIVSVPDAEKQSEWRSPQDDAISEHTTSATASRMAKLKAGGGRYYDVMDRGEIANSDAQSVL